MIAALLLVAPTPSPSPSDVNIDGSPVGSPGFLGFVFTFLLAVALVFLFLSLTKQLRVVDRRAKKLGLDDDEAGDDRTAGPHADLGLVDADVAVAPWEYVEDEQAPDPPRGSGPDEPGPAGGSR